MDKTVDAFITVFNHVMHLGTYNENIGVWHFTGMDFHTMRQIEIIAAGSPNTTIHLHWYDDTEHNMRGEYVDIVYKLYGTDMVIINQEQAITAAYLHFANVLQNLAVTFVGNELPDVYSLTDSVSVQLFSILYALVSYHGNKYETDTVDTLWDGVQSLTLESYFENGSSTVSIRDNYGRLLSMFSMANDVVLCYLKATPMGLYSLVNKLCREDLVQMFTYIWRYAYLHALPEYSATVDQHLIINANTDMYLEQGMFRPEDISQVSTVCNLYNRWNGSQSTHAA